MCGFGVPKVVGMDVAAPSLARCASAFMFGVWRLSNFSTLFLFPDNVDFPSFPPSLT